MLQTGTSTGGKLAIMAFRKTCWDSIKLQQTTVLKENNLSLGKDQTLILIVHNHQQDSGEQKKVIIVFTNLFPSRFICPINFRLYFFLTLLLPTNKKEHPVSYFDFHAVRIYYSAQALNSCKGETWGNVQNIIPELTKCEWTFDILPSVVSKQNVFLHL